MFTLDVNNKNTVKVIYVTYDKIVIFFKKDIFCNFINYIQLKIISDNSYNLNS